MECTIKCSSTTIQYRFNQFMIMKQNDEFFDKNSFAVKFLR